MNNQTSKKGVLSPISHGFMSLLVYGMIFIPLMILLNGSITLETVVIPAAVIYIVVRLTEYITMKKNSEVPRWLVLGSAGVGFLTAVGMTLFLIL